MKNAILSIFFAVSATVAAAQSPEYICGNISSLAESIANARDNYVPHAMAQDLIIAQNGHPAIENFTLDLIDTIYENPQTPPRVFGLAAYIACMDAFGA